MILFFTLVLEFFASLLGPLFTRKTSAEGLHLWIAFAAGTVISVAIIHMLPESVEQSEFAPIAFLFWFCSVYIAEHFFTSHLCHEEKHQHLTLASWFWLSLHTLFDGIAIAAGFYFSQSIGVLVALAILLHQIPVSLSLWGLIRHAHFKTTTSYALLISFALMIPLGAWVATLFHTLIGWEGSMALLFAFSGGTMLFIGASDLLPYVHANTVQHQKIVSVFCLAVALICLLSYAGHEVYHGL